MQQIAIAIVFRLFASIVGKEKHLLPQKTAMLA